MDDISDIVENDPDANVIGELELNHLYNVILYDGSREDHRNLTRFYSQITDITLGILNGVDRAIFMYTKHYPTYNRLWNQVNVKCMKEYSTELEKKKKLASGYIRKYFIKNTKNISATDFSLILAPMLNEKVKFYFGNLKPSEKERYDAFMHNLDLTHKLKVPTLPPPHKP